MARNSTKAAKKPRKMYPRVRADQRGTNMETFIKSNEMKLADSNVKREPEMTSADVKGKAYQALKRAWKGREKTGNSARNVRKFMDAKNVSRVKAKAMIKASHTVSFGADPKRK